MVRRNGLMFLGTSVLTSAVIIGSSLTGCQSNSTSSAASTTTGGGGDTGSSTSSGKGGDATGTGGGATTGTGGGATTSTGTGTGGGGVVQAATIQDITTKKVGPGLQVKLEGVVAMSQKFLVSKGSASGSCLWGVFVSAPNLAETGPNTGILVLNYGDNAKIPEGGSQAFCPRLGIDSIGDKIPDDTKPGDVLEVIGETSYFLLGQCADQPAGSTVGQFQIAKSSSISKVGSAAVPKLHVFTADELSKAADPDDAAFHDQWGGVKVAITNVISEPLDDGMGGMGITNKFGQMLVHDKTIANPMAGDKLQIADKLFYRGYLKGSNACFDGPMYANPITEFSRIEGFSYLDFCTWDLQPNDKCADLTPSSEDCTSNVMCLQ